MRSQVSYALSHVLSCRRPSSAQAIAAGVMRKVKKLSDAEFPTTLVNKLVSPVTTAPSSGSSPTQLSDPPRESTKAPHILVAAIVGAIVGAVGPGVVGAGDVGSTEGAGVVGHDVGMLVGAGLGIGVAVGVMVPGRTATKSTYALEPNAAAGPLAL